MGRTSPVVAQFEFAARVRRRREELGLPAATVSKHCGFTRNFYSAVENSRSLLATAKLPLLIEALQFDDADAQTLTTLLEQARTPGWWQPYLPILDEAFVQFLGLEYGASRIQSYENLVFNGLLQCPLYAEAVVNSSLDNTVVEKKRSLELRMKRQSELLDKFPVPQLQFLVGEAVLWQQFGGSDVLLAQLRHIVDLAERLGPSFDLRIRPFQSTPIGLVSASTTVILRFESPQLLPMVYREAGPPMAVTSQPEIVDRMLLNYEHALHASYDLSRSIAAISDRIRALEVGL